jgi:hypothetical protein
MKMSILKATALLALILAFSIPAFGQQNCYATLTIDNIMYIDRDGTSLISMPVYFTNDCSVGGIMMDIHTDPFGALEPVGLDTVGSPISYWEYFFVHKDAQRSRLRFVGIADWPGGEQTPPYNNDTLVVLFNILMRFGCDYSESVSVSVYFDSVVVTDSSGYNNFNLHLDNATVYVGNEVTPIDRGDSNCNGSLIGSDVTYLVSYFRGMAECPCSMCAGDANGDGSIIGSDVTYLVRYFANLGDPPPPCEQ